MNFITYNLSIFIETHYEKKVQKKSSKKKVKKMWPLDTFEKKTKKLSAPKFFAKTAFKKHCKLI